MSTRKINDRVVRSAALVAMAVAGAPQASFAGTTANTVTISLAGSTALRNFTTSPSFTALPAGFSLTLSNGTYNGGSNGLQLAQSTYPVAIIGTGASAGGVRLEWQESGSVEGMLALVNDQIGYGTSANPPQSSSVLDPNVPLNPTGGNPIWVNRTRLSTTTTGGGLSTSTAFNLGSSDYNTYSTSTFTSSGVNLQGGQNRVQMDISDVPAVQGWSYGGASAKGSVFATPGSAGYGKGNAILATGTATDGIGTAGTRQQLADTAVLNMGTNTYDPSTGQKYAVGPWNTAGVNNLYSNTVAVTATTFSANPGTGLTSINKTDAQFLQVAARLSNGLSFQMTTRDIDSGTRNTAANNTGIDPSYAGGVNDGGNGYNTNVISGANTFGTDAVAQASIGPAIKFSGKTAGGGQLRPTIENARMAIGTLGISDARSGNAVSSTSSTTPLRALEYSTSTYDASHADGSFNPVLVSAQTITDGTYAIWQQEQYVAVRNPTSITTYNNPNSYKGDPNGDVAAIANNVLNSVTNFPNPLSTFDPADGLLNTGFVLPQMMLVAKPYDGAATTDVSNNTVVIQGSTYTHAQLQQLLVGSSYAAAFSANNPNVQNQGAGSFYGVATAQNIAGPNGGTNINTVVGPAYAGANRIAITASNYLFGNFNQNGIRDLSAIEAAQAAQAAMVAYGVAHGDTVSQSTDMYSTSTNVGNATVIAGLSSALSNMAGQNGTTGGSVTGATKGDLIVMGDYNSDGKFDGADLYDMAIGCAVADKVGSSTLTVAGTPGTPTFNDNLSLALRSGTLVKNAALDYLSAHATLQQKTDAAVNSSSTAIANAFNKADVNHDGNIDLNDAFVIDANAGLDYTNLTDQTNAHMAIDGSNNAALPQVSISLVMTKLVDTNPTDPVAVRDVNQADMSVMNAALTGTLSYTWASSTVKAGNLAIVAAPVAGTISVPAGATFTINSGSFTAGGNIDLFTSGTNLPSSVITHLAIVNNAGFGVAGSTKTVASLTGTGSTTVTGTLVIAPAASQSTVSLQQSTISITGSGTVTLSNDAILSGMTEPQVDALIAGRYLLQGNTNPLVGLGVITNSDGQGNALYATFDGVPVTAGEVLVKTTLLGDTTLKGYVDGTDVANLLAGMSGGLTGWVNGDTNYDGVVNAVDLSNLLASLQSGLNFGTSGSGGTLGGAVPEPSSMLLAAVAAPVLLTRRRRGAAR
jgi:hypothetical protein